MVGLHLRCSGKNQRFGVGLRHEAPVSPLRIIHCIGSSGRASGQGPEIYMRLRLRVSEGA